MRLVSALALSAAITLTTSAVGQKAPAGATARCRDGTYSFSQHRRGTCSHHRGVAEWLTPRAAPQQPPTGAVLQALDTLGVMPPRGPAVCGGHCGTERWAVKTLSDQDRGLVQLRPVHTTIKSLVSLRRPASLPATHRERPLETTVYEVEARLLYLFTESDNDYHIVLASPQDTTVTMIAEVPDPQCAGACSSGLAARYGQVRQQLLDYLNSPQSVARPLVRITGVGFFDFIHGQRGVAPNGIELHPVLRVALP